MFQEVTSIFKQCYAPERWDSLIEKAEIVFSDEGGMYAYGEIYKIPFALGAKEFLHNTFGIIIPDEQTSIDLLSMCPQEAVSKEARTIQPSQSNTAYFDHQRSQLFGIISGSFCKWDNTYALFYRERFRPYWILGQILKNSIPTDDSLNLFNNILDANPSKGILLINGHGGYEPWQIGEQTRYSTNPDQTPGNLVLAESLVARFNQPEKYSAICISACKLQDTPLVGRDLPVFYPVGVSSWSNRWSGELQGKIYLPENYY